MMVCVYIFIVFKLTKTTFQKLRTIKQRPTTQFLLSRLRKGKDDRDREDVPLRKPPESQAKKQNAKNHLSLLKKMKPDE